MELEEEILGDKIRLAVLHFKAQNYTQCASIYSGLVSNLSALSDARVIKTRRHYQLSDAPVYGKLVHPKLCTILDQRAATYEKLNSRGLARQDARKIIDLDPVNCKGYLRLGKLLMMDNDKVAAYKTYQQGVFLIQRAVAKSGISVPERLWSQLQQSYRDLNRALKQERGTKSESDSAPKAKAAAEKTRDVVPNLSRGLQGQLDKMLPLKRVKTEPAVPQKRQKSSRDFFGVFPDEVIECVFSHLPFRELLKALQVCKSWYETLTRLPSLYQNCFTLKHRVTAPEYFQGLKLMKRASRHSFSQSIHFLSVWSTLNVQNLGRILESVISDKSLKLHRLHLIDKSLSLELFMHKLEKCSWDYTGLASVKHLRLGVSSSLYNENILFEVFPSLESLEILSVDAVHRRANLPMVPSFSEKYHQLVASAKATHQQATLKKLSLVNNPSLKRERQTVQPGEKTFDPKPPFLSMSLPVLTELKITDYDFSGHAVEFQQFMRNASSLSDIYLENNHELSLKKFLLLLASCSPDFKLKKLTLRENHQDGSYNIDEVGSDDCGSISALEHLDIYGTSLSGTGFLKLLTIINQNGSLTSINIGQSSYIQFKNDSLASRNTVLQFSQLFELVPSIHTLLVPELNLDNMSLRLLREDAEKLYGGGKARIRLRNLDLSFCHSVDGIGLMNLFRSNGAGHVTLETLTLDGMHFKPETLQLLQKRGFVKSLQNDPFKRKWKTYGVTSQVLDC